MSLSKPNRPNGLIESEYTMTIAIIDNGTDNAITVDTDALDARSIMLASAASIASTVVKVEGELAATAKTWGANLFSLAFPADDVKPVALDTLIGDSKLATGWATLTHSEAGTQAKRKLEVYFSNARLVAESFESLTDDEKRDIRAGLVSIHYKAGLIRKAAADAKRAADKEAKRVAAEAEEAKAKEDADASAGEASAPVTAAAPMSLKAMVEALHLAMADASDADLIDASQAMVDFLADYDVRQNAIVDAGVAIAA